MYTWTDGDSMLYDSEVEPRFDFLYPNDAAPSWGPFAYP